MKRARSSSQSSRGSVDTQPAVANAVDAELEAQLGRLDIDDDFKDSIRAMTPDTRREVMNDIVRNQAAAAIDVPPHLVFNGAQEGHPMHFAMEHVMADDDDDNDGFGNDRDDVAQQQGGGFDFAQFLMALLTERGVAVNGRADPHNGFLNVLTNISNQVQQHRIMQEMGITEEDMDNMSYEDLLALEERIGNISKGLRPEQMKRTYTVAKASSKPRDERCAVCQEEWSENTAHKRVELNSCHHEFHEDCICTWLASNKTCPICKQEVI